MCSTTKNERSANTGHFWTRLYHLAMKIPFGTSILISFFFFYGGGVGGGLANLS